MILSINYFSSAVIVVFLTFFISLAGCSVTQKSSDFDIIANNGPWAIEGIISDPDRLHARDSMGRTLLHEAAVYNPMMIDPLLQAGLDLNAVDKQGMTPLHLAVLRNETSIVPLLKHHPDMTLKSKGSVRCSAKKVRKQGLSVMDLINQCELEKARSRIVAYQAETQFWKHAERQSTYQSYDIYLSNYPSGIYSELAIKSREHVLNRLEQELENNQSCPITDSEYYLLTNSCKDGLAHGPGEAKTPLGKRFVGTFHHGDMHHGKMYAEGTLVWDGPIVEGIPHGKGVCRYNEEMEVCETYEGKRIDVLFKQRLLMVQQMEMMQAQMDGLRRDVRASSYQTAQSSDVDSEYLVDLFSDDKNKRTVAQVRAAVDLFSFLIKNTREKK